MMKQDLRKMGGEQLEKLRIKALDEVEKCHNITKVARELGINRQVLHRWIKKSKGIKLFHKPRRGRIKTKLYKQQSDEIVNVFAQQLPEAGINAEKYWWSVETIKKYISDNYGLEFSSYFVRRWLHDICFFSNRNHQILDEPYMGGKSIKYFANFSGMLCYTYWEKRIGFYPNCSDFHCISSARGDIRFVSDKACEINVFFNHIQSVAKKKVIIVCDEYFYYGYYLKHYLSKNIILLKKKGGKMTILNP